MAGDTGKKDHSDNKGADGDGGDGKAGDGSGNGDGKGGDGGDGDDGDGDDGDGGDSKKKKTVSYHALHEEREKRKAGDAKNAELQKKVDDMEAADADKKRKRAEKKGEHEKLYKAELAKNADLEKSNKSLEARILGFEGAVEKRIETVVSSLRKEEDKVELREALEGLPLSKQESLLPKLMKGFADKKNLNKGAGDGDGKQGDKATKLQEAKKAGNRMAILANAPDAK